MGADLYIKSITDAAEKRNQPKFNQAVSHRDSLMLDRQRMEQIIDTYRKTHASNLPSVAAAMKRLEGRLDGLKVQIAEAQAAVTKYYDRMYPSAGYFRDSYNGTSVLWRMGLSWWQDVKSGNKTSVGLKNFLTKVKRAKLKRLTLADLKRDGCAVDDGENSVEAWNRYMRNKRRRLIRFLERAIRYAEQGTVVHFSV